MAAVLKKSEQEEKSIRSKNVTQAGNYKN